MALVSEAVRPQPSSLKVEGLDDSSSVRTQAACPHERSTNPEVLKPGQIPGSDTYSVFRHRKHKVSTKFELFEPKLGTHLAAKLEKASGSVTFAISDWRRGETAGWLCCNAKGDTFVLFENVDTGCETGPEPAATLALAWKLSPDNSRRVDAIKLAPDYYKPLETSDAYGGIEAPSIDQLPEHDLSCSRSEGSSSGSSEDLNLGSRETVQHAGNASPSGLLERRKGKGLSLAVSVPTENTGIREEANSADPMTVSNISGPQDGNVGSKSGKRSSWASWGPASSKAAGYTSLEEPLVESNEPDPEDGSVLNKSESLVSPGVQKLVDSLKRTMSNKAGSGEYVPLPNVVESSLSPKSVLDTTKTANSSAQPSPTLTPEIQSLGSTPLPSPTCRTVTIATGKGSSELLKLLNAMMSNGLEETELPQGAMTLRSAQPKWDEAKQTNTLAFGGLVHQKSVKNMALLVFGEGGNEVAHPEFRTQTPTSTRPCLFGGGNLPLHENLLDPEHTYNEEIGRRALIIGRHKAQDGSEFVCSHDPASISKIQAFAIAIASCMKKACYQYI